METPHRSLWILGHPAESRTSGGIEDHDFGCRSQETSSEKRFGRPLGQWAESRLEFLVVADYTEPHQIRTVGANRKLLLLGSSEWCVPKPLLSKLTENTAR
jgi:hypothetical protein